jgi:periplasmic protein TonB
MKPKKSKTADLEGKKSYFFQIGMVITLALVMISLEWTTKPVLDDSSRWIASNYIQTEEIIYTRRDEPLKLKVVERPIEIINIVPDDLEISMKYDFDAETDQRTRIDIPDYNYGKEIFTKDEDFIKVEIMPSFNGGLPEVEFRKYIVQNLIYPQIAIENHVQGRVMVKFVVNQEGRVVDPEVLSGVDPSLDKEAVRVIMSSPLWTPGIQGGKKVRVLFVFPINFLLK